METDDSEEQTEAVMEKVAELEGEAASSRSTTPNGTIISDGWRPASGVSSSRGHGRCES